jgi:hypothetical protein
MSKLSKFSIGGGMPQSQLHNSVIWVNMGGVYLHLVCKCIYPGLTLNYPPCWMFLLSSRGIFFLLEITIFGTSKLLSRVGSAFRVVYNVPHAKFTSHITFGNRLTWDWLRGQHVGFRAGDQAGGEESFYPAGDWHGVRGIFEALQAGRPPGRSLQSITVVGIDSGSR